VKAAQERKRLEELQRRFQHLYGGRRPLVVMLFPTLGEHNHLLRIREAIEGLRLLHAEVLGDLTVVCRFRSVELADRYRALGLEAALRKDPRIVIDLGSFTTYEWFALADLVIVSSVSTGIIEAAAAGKPTFTFDYRLLAEKVFAPYGKELVLKNRHDLMRAFRGISSGFRGFDCQWDRLARDFSRYSDGGCLERFRRVILSAIEEVERKEGFVAPRPNRPAVQEMARHA
jgi:glycosyltransferase involved in cell wall biosynthesis